MLDPDRNLSREHESETFARLCGDIRLVVPTSDIVLQILLLRFERSLLLFQTVKFGEVQRIIVEGGHQLHQANNHDNHRDEERDRSAVPACLGGLLGALTRRFSRTGCHTDENTRRIRLANTTGIA